MSTPRARTRLRTLRCIVALCPCERQLRSLLSWEKPEASHKLRVLVGHKAAALARHRGDLAVAIRVVAALHPLREQRQAINLRLRSRDVRRLRQLQGKLARLGGPAAHVLDGDADVLGMSLDRGRR